jgi:hypothetical protein
MSRTLKRALAAAALLLLGGILLAFAAAPGADGRLQLGAKQPFLKGSYLAYAQPWGGEQIALLRWWSRRADTISVDAARFPANTTMSWRWPPFRPPNSDVGVWAYDLVAFGNYDDGEVEKPIPPRRIDAIRELRQRFAWRMTDGIGDANVLTEFYLRSNPRQPDSKVLEIGWFLHVPEASAEFARKSRQIGVFTDPQRRRWRVALEGTYCMIQPADGRDVATGELDMLAAVRWLKGKGLVKGDEWFTGIAIGAEPMSGVGSLHLDRWSVTYR